MKFKKEYSTLLIIGITTLFIACSSSHQSSQKRKKVEPCDCPKGTYHKSRPNHNK